MSSVKLLPRIACLSLLGVLTVGAALLAGCDSSNDPPPELFANWQLQEFVLDSGENVVPGNQTYIVTFSGDGTASVRSDCNLCNGPYSADGDRLSFGSMTCTVAACPPGSLDTQFQAALSSASSFEIIDGALFLDYEGGVMRFLPVDVMIL